MTRAAPVPSDPEGATRRRGELFSNRNYLWLWVGGSINSLGDYFTLIAMPWLVLTLSGDAATLGFVMALETLPRAAFMLVSGSFADRYSPRTVLLVSRSVFALALVALAADIWTGHISVGHLYVFAVAFGLPAAFSIPANRALLPQVVAKSHIQVGNSMLMGSQQIIQLVAPILAGLLIWSAPAITASPKTGGLSQIGYAFAFNAVAAVIAVILIARIRVPAAPATARPAGPILTATLSGFSHVWRDRGLLTATLYMACVGFFAIGPLLTVIPQFAASRLEDGALSYGTLYAINGLGSLLGFACGGLLPRPDRRNLGRVMLSADLLAGVGILGLAYSHSLAAAAPALALIGLGASYGGVLGLSWIQERVPHELAGRVIGIVSFAVLGLTPVSMSLAGLIVSATSIGTLLSISGGAIAFVALVGLAIPGIHRFATFPSP